MTLDNILYVLMALLIFAAFITLIEKLYSIAKLIIENRKKKKGGDHVHQFDITKDV